MSKPGAMAATTALICIDMQNDFLAPDSPLCVKGGMACLPHVRAAVQAAREAKVPVIWVIREHDPSGEPAGQLRRAPGKGAAVYGGERRGDRSRGTDILSKAVGCGEGGASMRCTSRLILLQVGPLGGCRLAPGHVSPAWVMHVRTLMPQVAVVVSGLVRVCG